MQRVRRWLYRRGHRPRPGTFFHSPGLALIYAMKDAGGVNAFIREIEREDRS